MHRVAWLSFMFVFGASAANLVPIPALGLRVASGFRVSVFADSDLANDVTAMTLDAAGDVVVTGPGYIRTLHDADNNGVADSATLFATTKTGGMGMCFDGPNLMFVGDGALMRFSDTDGDGVADGQPQRLLALNFLEHGGHAVRKGPDGWWYVIAGNETSFTNEHYNLQGSPIVGPEAGAMLRLPPDGAGSEVIAEGFRNPYDFDFNAMGDVFTWDSDVESDLFLPWYTPTRVYHMAYGGHHGWRLPGWRRSWNRPNYYADVAEMLTPLGRSSPTGVACYRHYQFPLAYRNGVFALDWTFGRVVFLGMRPAGASYDVAPEVFLEAMGTQGFAPSDVAVSRDGSLLVSVGGRKTRGAVYRIEYVGQRNAALAATRFALDAASDLEAALIAPQPLDAWGREYWVPIAARLGAPAFVAAALDGGIVPGQRMRAIEILTEQFGGLPEPAAALLARANQAQVRARAAWSIGRAPGGNAQALLVGLSRDADAGVRRVALEGLLEQGANAEAALANLGHPDARIRQAAVRLAARVSGPEWNALWNGRTASDVTTRLSLVLALLWRDRPSEVHTAAIDAAIAALPVAQNTAQRLEAIRLMMLGLGDWNLHAPSAEVYTGYEPAFSLRGHEAVVARVGRAVRPFLSSGDATLDFEAARLLAMVEERVPEAQVLIKVSEQTTATSDFHYLTVLSKVSTNLSTNTFTRVATSILALDRKLEGQQLRNKQNWSARLAEVVARMVQHQPGIADAILRHTTFGLPSHVALVPSLGTERRAGAARVFLNAQAKKPNFVWTPQLIDLLSSLPSAEVFPVFRKQWNNLALRDELVLRFAAKPEPVDREKFLVGLGSVRSDVVLASAGALMELPPDGSATTILPTMRALRRSLNEPREQGLRGLLLALLRHGTGEAFAVQETGDVRRAYQPVFNWFARKFPTLVRSLEATEGVDISYWLSLLPAVQWAQGNAARGEILFQNRGCQTCHASASPVGPDLAGVTTRLSTRDLIVGIADPSRDIAAPYRSTTFRLQSGETHTGVVVFESAEGVIVQTSVNTTIRLATADIVSRVPSAVSLMPAGLLNGLGRAELADLHAYLSRLPAR